MSFRRCLPALALLPGLAGTQAHARTEIHPYIEAQQVFSADLSGHDNDAVTYTGIGAGIDISFDSHRLQGQLDYRYDHYFSWSNRYGDGDVHTGLANGVYSVTPEMTLNAAGIAARTRGSLSGSSPGLYQGDFNNTQQIYAVQAGPSYAGHFGDLNVDADYRYSWTKVDDGIGSYDLGPGQPILDPNFVSTAHTIDASAGMAPHHGLPFGWTVSGGYIRDSIHYLGARYDGSFVRGDIVQPISPTLALEGGAGYEWNKTGQNQILTDAAGNAVLDDHRRLQSDHHKPRVLSYDEQGLIWDVGVLWRPSPRLSLEVRGGRRYGEWEAIGNLTWKVSPTATVQVVAYNDIQSFGRQLGSGIGGLSTSFVSPTTSLPINLGGCVFGANGGTGGCLPALSSVNSNFYRSRGVYALYSATRGRWTYGLGADYDYRRYLANDLSDAGVYSFSGVHDQTVTVNGIVTRTLTANSSLSGTAYFAWYKTALFNSPSYETYGVTGAYTRSFSRRLVGQAAISVYSGSGGDFDQDVVGSALLGVRYQL